MDLCIDPNTVTSRELDTMAKAWHGGMVKGVADISRGRLALGGAWHKDARDALVASGSNAHEVWGFRIHLNKEGYTLDFTSHINDRPEDGNNGIVINNKALRERVATMVARKVPFLDTG